MTNPETVPYEDFLDMKSGTKVWYVDYRPQNMLSVYEVRFLGFVTPLSEYNAEAVITNPRVDGFARIVQHPMTYRFHRASHLQLVSVYALFKSRKAACTSLVNELSWAQTALTVAQMLRLGEKTYKKFENSSRGSVTDEEKRILVRDLEKLVKVEHE